VSVGVLVLVAVFDGV
jgi:hypothetical protein